MGWLKTKQMKDAFNQASFHRLLFPHVYGFIHLAERRTFYKDNNIVLNWSERGTWRQAHNNDSSLSPEGFELSNALNTPQDFQRIFQSRQITLLLILHNIRPHTWEVTQEWHSQAV